MAEENLAPLRLAIVEDNSAFRKDLRRVLASVPGWEVVAECIDAGRALADLPASQPDIVLLDLGLPGTSGLDLIRPLKRSLPATTAIVVLTVSKSGADIFNAIQEGACSYIFKGTGPAELVEALRDVATGQAPFLGAPVSRKLVQWIQRSHETDRHGLSDREWEILQLAAKGKQGAEIAGALGIALNTVKNHFRNIYGKLEVTSRADALIKIKGGRGLIDGS